MSDVAILCIVLCVCTVALCYALKGVAAAIHDLGGPR
jgi:hypothetical protein